MNDKEIELKLTVAEANGVLHALGQMPYTQVFQLIAKIQLQAQRQMNPEGAGSQ